MAASPLATFTARLQDPFGFSQAFEGLTLAADDLPGLTRDCRLAGAGC